MEVFGDKKHQKNIKQFVCEKCDFSCSKKGDWNRHIIRPKHINLASTNTFVTEKTSKSNYTCELCNKEYQSRNGLWSHKKVCNVGKHYDPADKDQIILMLIKENSEFKNMMMEQQKQILEVCKNGTNNIGSVS
jgi:hypothetical protein